MFTRSILTAVALAAASAHAQLTITSPGPNDWWVAQSVNTLAWTCNTAPSTESAFTVVLSNTNTAILSAPLALIPNVPNYMCSYTVNAQLSSQPVSNSYTLSLTNIQNISDIYASTPFQIQAFGSAYPTSTSSAPGSSTGTAGTPTSTSTSKSNAAAANYIPVGMSMAAALFFGLVVA